MTERPARDPALVILNGTSDAQTSEQIRILAAGRRMRVEVTEGAGHAQELAYRAAEAGTARVVAAGGDGTVHEVAAGLLAAGAPADLGLIPAGTGNDLARALQIPLDIEAAFAHLELPSAAVDVVRLILDGRSDICINALNGGFSGQVQEEVTEEAKGRWGRLGYLFTATSTLSELVTYTAQLDLEGERPEALPMCNLTLGNGPSVGGGFPIAPDADPTDGLVDVILVKPASVPRLTTLLPAVLRGEEPESELFTSWKVTKGRIGTDPRLPFSLDGELTAASAIEFEVLPGALRVLGANRPAE